LERLYNEKKSFGRVVAENYPNFKEYDLEIVYAKIMDAKQ
jgi:hypothetical protein